MKGTGIVRMIRLYEVVNDPTNADITNCIQRLCALYDRRGNIKYELYYEPYNDGNVLEETRWYYNKRGKLVKFVTKNLFNPLEEPKVYYTNKLRTCKDEFPVEKKTTVSKKKVSNNKYIKTTTKTTKLKDGETIGLTTRKIGPKGELLYEKSIETYFNGAYIDLSDSTRVTREHEYGEWDEWNNWHTMKSIYTREDAGEEPQTTVLYYIRQITYFN